MPIAADKSHGRIIWDCAWSCEGDLFATASRDKTVSVSDFGERFLIDRPSGKNMEAALGLCSMGSNYNNEIRGSSNRCRVLFCRYCARVSNALLCLVSMTTLSRRWIAVGLETGEIKIYSSLVSTPDQWTPVLTIDSK
jgi:elongator complex protein 2